MRFGRRDALTRCGGNEEEKPSLRNTIGSRAPISAPANLKCWPMVEALLLSPQYDYTSHPNYATTNCANIPRRA